MFLNNEVDLLDNTKKDFKYRTWTYLGIRPCTFLLATIGTFREDNIHLRYRHLSGITGNNIVPPNWSLIIIKGLCLIFKGLCLRSVLQ